MAHVVQRDRITVVLVSPRNPLNIGAAARAMANFGFTQLLVVAPYEAHWREARSAVGAPEILSNAKETTTLAEGVADSTLVIGTAAVDKRTPEQRIVSLPALPPIVHGEITRGGRIAIVFGPEKRGLTREDLSSCHLLVEIPTDPRQPSMNLGQAVAVCLYELGSRWPEASANPVRLGFEAGPWGTQCVGPEASAAPSAMLDRLAEVIGQTMVESNYSPRSMQVANRHDLHLLLRRLSLTEADARRFLGVFRRILWRLRQPAR